MNRVPGREEIGQRVRAQLGAESTEEMVSSVVERVMALLPTLHAAEPGSPQQLLIHAYGRNRPGILAAITRVLAGLTCDIVDISLTLHAGQFALNLVVDTPTSLTVDELEEALGQPARELDIRVSLLTNSTAGPTA